jgi:hypothetical protein
LGVAAFALKIPPGGSVPQVGSATRCTRGFLYLSYLRRQVSSISCSWINASAGMTTYITSLTNRATAILAVLFLFKTGSQKVILPSINIYTIYCLLSIPYSGKDFYTGCARFLYRVYKIFIQGVQDF